MISLLSRQLLRIAVAVAALTWASQQADAAILANYQFPGGGAASSDLEPNSTASNFSTTGSLPGWGFSSGGNVFTRSPFLANSEAASLASGDYFSFTVTPDAWFQLSLTSLTFDTIHNATAGVDFPDWSDPDPSATISFFVRSSLDNFGSNIGPTFSQGWDSGASRSLDLSGAAFQSIDGPVEFRFYLYHDISVNTRQGGRIDNVILNGEVSAVPEPSAAVLAGLGLAGLALMIRRMKRS